MNDAYSKRRKMSEWGRKISFRVLELKWMEDSNKKTCTVDETEGHFSVWIFTLMHANVTLFKCYSLSNKTGLRTRVHFYVRSPATMSFLLYYYFYFLFFGESVSFVELFLIFSSVTTTGNHSYIQASFCFISFYLFFRFLHNFSIVECPFIFDFSLSFIPSFSAF